LGFEKSQRSVTHDFLRYINTYSLPYLLEGGLGPDCGVRTITKITMIGVTGTKYEHRFCLFLHGRPTWGSGWL